jgi:hypothetical protein
VASAVRSLSFVDSCFVGNVVKPPVDPTVAPGPPEVFAPYVIEQFALEDMLTPVTWIVEPDAPTVPPGHVVVVNPAFDPVVDGADQPAGIAIESWPDVIVLAAV